MKIRIKGNSIRYRLTKSEVDKLYQTGILKEFTEFIGNTFTYVVETTAEPQMAATFTGNTITLLIPKKMADELYHTDRVGHEGKSGTVSLLIEKDFVCIDNTVEDQADNYPNPTIC
jgi:hypothetical protein